MSGAGEVQCARLSAHAWELVIDRPAKRNALTRDMARQLIDALEMIARDHHPRALLLRSTGPVFCAGADLSELRQRAGRASDVYLEDDPHSTLVRAVARSTMPIISAVQGAAIGGAVAMVAGSTISVAGESSTFRLPEARLGVFPAGLVPYLAPRVGVAMAIRWGVLAEPLTAFEAKQAGLIDEIVADDAVDRRAHEIAETLASLDASVINSAMSLRQLLLWEGSPSRAYGRLVDALFWPPIGP